MPGTNSRLLGAPSTCTDRRAASRGHGINSHRRRLSSLAALLLVFSPLMTRAASPTLDLYAEERQRLVDQIELEVQATSAFLGTSRLDPNVIRAMRRVPRERFVPKSARGSAYANHPLPIGDGQTISQPYIVAIMSHLLGVSPGQRVYELGTGSGYQAAVLAEMGIRVYSVEILPRLAERAASTLAALGYENANVRAGDGYLGWPEHAPFDGIIVTAAHDEVPRPLTEQLAPGGRMIMPIGGVNEVQQLMLLTKQPDGSLSRRETLPVRFVPVTGPAAR